MKITAKTFVAVCDFVVGGDEFAAGDVVPAGRTLLFLLGFGDTFVVEDVALRASKGANQNKENGV